jgi:predicted ABC-type transport system involved in lysophospholipase L1 biosynthesis ATPase subunit
LKRTSPRGRNDQRALRRVVSSAILPPCMITVAPGSQIIELMLELNRAQGTTLILVTHDEALARRCNRQLHLAAGRVV